VILVSVFVFIFLKGYKIAMGAKDRLGFLLAISITTWITLQAVLHIGANVALIPINGNTLPFLSYGGSSTVINLSAIGILLNIAKGGSQSEERRVVSLPQRSRPQLHKLRKRR
jgi:cell division protein FtsW